MNGENKSLGAVPVFSGEHKDFASFKLRLAGYATIQDFDDCMRGARADADDAWKKKNKRLMGTLALSCGGNYKAESIIRQFQELENPDGRSAWDAL